MMKQILFAASIMAGTSAVFAEAPMSELIDKTMKTGEAHARNMLVEMKSHPGKTPRMYENGKFVSSKIEWWCSGFFPGSLWYLYENSKSPEIEAAAREYTESLEPLIKGRTDHDIGFQFYCSYGNGYRLTGDEKYKSTLLSAAEKLTGRFDETVGCIRSWDGNNKGKWQYPVIIDNMMNLELLEFAAKNSENPAFAKVARAHADKTLEHHYRPDSSSYHVVSYDRKSGLPHLKQTWQGLADDSAWSRGQAWGLYGYTMMARETGSEKYLEQAEKIAKFIIGHKNMPADKIPYWDFDAPAGDDTLRDASAGAIMASAFIELSTLTKDAKLAKECREIAERQIRSLASDEYLAPIGTNGNFMLKHSVGSIPHKNELDVPLTYADYYFLEAMTRWKNLDK